MEQFPTVSEAEVSKRSEILAQLSIIEQNLDNIKRMLEESPNDANLQQQLDDGKQYRKIGMNALYELADSERVAAQNIGDATTATAATDPSTLGQQAPGTLYADSQGVLHSDMASARDNEPDNWRITNQK